MYCSNCGSKLFEKAKFCTNCGTEIATQVQTINSEKNSVINDNSKLIGYSSKINDPAFARYIKNSNRWSTIFAFIFALVAVIGFFIYGETSYEMDNPQALFIGLGIGSMFILIAMFRIRGRNRSKTWDGEVVDKKIEQKKRKRYKNEENYYLEDYTLFTVFIRSDDGKIHTYSTEDDDAIYNYYKIGDKVRHHGSLNSYEKYDKSEDIIIFCNACASLNNISQEYCHRCKCPLLK